MNDDRSLNDRNFDDLAYRFQRNVYGGLKGKIRLAVLERDFNHFYPAALQKVVDQPLQIIDAGGGCGPFSLPMARRGHCVTLCDLSEKMLDIATQHIQEQDIEAQVKIVHGAIQALEATKNSVDLILCHAVLEWVKDPAEILRHLTSLLKPNGVLSLTFYNKDGMIFKNLLRTNYKKIQQQDYEGYKGSLTPTWPRTCSEVEAIVNVLPLELLTHSGMRVFHDYILDRSQREKEPQSVIELELAFSQHSAFMHLGRYQHFLLRKHDISL